ncbi:hypothetical protein VSDG_02289 [Cytospora chrysosperma]|uniref:Uncharacterized protein n=1 Tax=Cytospora chrysosperma TaxID=252740 RepID=A0A423WDZ6_CYTCH|nr:hypothetical protein VSDG_02289 [Valsa sordida]
MRPRLSSHYTGSILCTLGIKRGPNRADLDNRSRNSVYFGLLLWIPAQNSARGSSILNGFMACSQNYKNYEWSGACFPVADPEVHNNPRLECAVCRDLDPKEEDEEEDEKQEAIVSRRTAYVLCVIMG